MQVETEARQEQKQFAQFIVEKLETSIKKRLGEKEGKEIEALQKKISKQK